MILCITLNPAVDRTARVPRLAIGEILRPVELVVLPGGKGNNVARAAHVLGAEVTTTGVVGGHAGRWIVDELGRAGLNPRFVGSEHESRTTYVVAAEGGRSVMVYEKGPAQPEAAFEELLALIAGELLARCAFVVLAGSVPAGVDPKYAGRVVAACNQAGVPCLVDTSGPSLRAALAERPSVVKGTADELAELAGPGRHDPVRLAREGVAQGARACIVTSGPRGAVAFAEATCWRVTVPLQRAVNSVGAGDAFTAGLVVALAESRSLQDALVSAGAAGAASVHELGAGFLDPETARRLAPQVRVSRVAT